MNLVKLIWGKTQWRVILCGSYTWSKLPDRGAVAPGRGQRRRRSWPGPTETHVAVRYHPRSEISNSFPSPSSSVKLSPALASLYKRFQLWEFTGDFHTKNVSGWEGCREGVFPYTADESPLPDDGRAAQLNNNKTSQLAASHTKSEPANTS